MLKEYTYHVKYSEEKEAYLKDRNIPYEITMIMNKIRAKIWFRINSSMENYEALIKDFESMGDKYSWIDVEYNENELDQAEYLWLFPVKQSIDIVNEDNFTYSCQYIDKIFGCTIYRHATQINDIVIRKEPSTKKRTAFWFESTGWSYIFTDFRVKNLVTSNNLQGIEFRDVYLKNGKKSEVLYQIDSPIRLKEEDLVFENNTKIEKCPNCGRNQYVMKGDQLLHLNGKKIDLNIDLFITDTFFGEGGGWSNYIISRRFYQLLKKYNLAGGLNLSPVIVEY